MLLTTKTAMITRAGIQTSPKRRRSVTSAIWLFDHPWIWESESGSDETAAARVDMLLRVACATDSSSSGQLRFDNRDRRTTAAAPKFSLPLRLGDLPQLGFGPIPLGELRVGPVKGAVWTRSW
jgi:hypothetical protein